MDICCECGAEAKGGQLIPIKTAIGHRFVHRCWTCFGRPDPPPELPDLAPYAGRTPYAFLPTMAPAYRRPQHLRGLQVEARLQIAAVIAAIPPLTSFGVGVFERQGLTDAECLAQLRQGRAELLEDTATFTEVTTWLEGSIWCKRQTINKQRSSYGLKHLAEQGLGEYVPNGPFMAAAIASRLDYQLIPDSPNVWFNLSTPWLKGQYRRYQVRRTARACPQPCPPSPVPPAVSLTRPAWALAPARIQRAST